MDASGHVRILGETWLAVTADGSHDPAIDRRDRHERRRHDTDGQRCTRRLGADMIASSNVTIGG